jgi:phage-related protein
MPPRLKKIKAIFYETAGGSKPVRTFLLGLPEEDRRIVGIDIATVEYGFHIRMPICRPVINRPGLSEVRSTIASGRVEARVYFAVENGKMVLLAAHRGKDDQPAEIAKAMKRLADYKRWN